jgi:hypothetical protein
MDVGTDSLNVQTLVANITLTVESMVKSHLRVEFDRISKHIGSTYNLDPDEVFSKICSLASVEPETVPVEKKKKVAKAPTTTEPLALCTMRTKAGTACKYRRVAGEGETMCKKHKNLHEESAREALRVEALPTEEQAWFNDKATFTTAHCPSYDEAPFEMDPDIVDDTQVYITDE